MIKLVIGLGNPGREYENTRHNVGFMVIDALVKRLKAKRLGKQCLSELFKGKVLGREVLLAKPLTYMNNSGLAVVNLLEEFSLEPQNMIVVYDDLDLPVGMTRLRLEGSSGGHKGMESIIKNIKTQKFPRLRIGIGRPKRKDQVVNYVLSPFDPDQKPLIDRAIEKASECIVRSLELSPEEVMEFCNRKDI